MQVVVGQRVGGWWVEVGWVVGLDPTYLGKIRKVGRDVPGGGWGPDPPPLYETQPVAVINSVRQEGFLGTRVLFQFTRFIQGSWSRSGGTIFGRPFYFIHPAVGTLAYTFLLVFKTLFANFHFIFTLYAKKSA